MALALLLLLGQFGSGLFPESPTTEGDEALQEQVERLLERQIDINRASAVELLAIPWLNPFLAYRIVTVRDAVGGFRKAGEVRQVPGMTDETYEAIRPFLRTRGIRPRRNGSVVSRASTDSTGSGGRGLRMFNRLAFQSNGVRVTALAEKDRGEASAFDFLSAGAEVRRGRLRATLGDFTAGFGQGLVLSAPQWRSSLSDGTGPGSQTARLVSSAAEGSYLRGGALAAGAGRWNLCLLGSYTGRDARLNDDGSVERLLKSGVHDDSAALASRNVVREATGGLSARYRASRAEVGLVAAYSHYGRRFGPSDSSSSFVGNELFTAGVNAGCRLGHYVLDVEAAGSSGTGLAGAFQLEGDWQDFNSRVAIRGRQARFFAPHGRWASLTGKNNRLDASGRLGWHHVGSSVSLSGNTYRDFELDSVPARVGLSLGQEVGGLALALGLGFRFRADRERCRTARAEVGGRIGRAATARLILADVYPEMSLSRGTMAAVRLNQGLGPVELGVSAARIAVSGTGVSMYLHEPGAGRIGSSYSTSIPCWRVSAACVVKPGQWLRLGLKTGCAWKPQAVPDGAAQLELMVPESRL